MSESVREEDTKVATNLKILPLKNLIEIKMFYLYSLLCFHSLQILKRNFKIFIKNKDNIEEF